MSCQLTVAALGAVRDYVGLFIANGAGMRRGKQTEIHDGVDVSCPTLGRRTGVSPFGSAVVGITSFSVVYGWNGSRSVGRISG